ncbi:Protein crumbs-like protein 3 [Plecturocebus cupreus]
MANPGLGLLLALGLSLLLARWGQVWGQISTASANKSSTVLPTPTSPSSSSEGALSQGAITAITVVFSTLAALLLVMGLALLVWKLQDTGPATEEQVGAHVPPTPNLKLPLEERLI